MALVAWAPLRSFDLCRCAHAPRPASEAWTARSVEALTARSLEAAPLAVKGVPGETGALPRVLVAVVPDKAEAAAAKIGGQPTLAVAEAFDALVLESYIEHPCRPQPQVEVVDLWPTLPQQLHRRRWLLHVPASEC